MTTQIHEGKASTYADDLGNSEAEERDDEDDTDTEDGDTDKDKSGKSGAGDTGQLSPDMSPKEEVIDKLATEKVAETRAEISSEPKSRSEFNAEIKALNKRRAEYPDMPLNEQIKEIEQEIDHLDRRVERLETLLDKTTLPQKLQKLISDMATKAKEFLAVRTEGQVKRELSESEKTERHERQIARYGRTYRESIHSQIRDMKDKIETLQSRETEYKKYRSFVTMIETEVMKLRASQAHTLSAPQKPDVSSITPVIPKLPEQAKPSSKASEKPAEAKAKVPDEHKPSPKTERLQESFGKAQGDKKPTASPKSEKPVQAKSQTSTETKTDTQKPIETKNSTDTKTPNPKNYKIEANAQTKQMLDKIQTELKAQKAQEATNKPAQPKTAGKDEGLKGQFRKPEQPPVKEEEHRRKTKAEAEKKRQDIPPEYRAPPYTKEELNPKQKSEPKAASSQQGESVLDKFKKMWKQETVKPQSNPEQPKQAKPRRPMSSSFNQASKSHIKQDRTVDAEESPKIK